MARVSESDLSCMPFRCRSREPEAVEQIGQTCYYMNRECIPERAVSELDWMYQSMMSATRCQVVALIFFFFFLFY